MKMMSLIEEGWSDKYKKSIDCNNPKGFSQKAHCAGRKKRNLSEEDLNDLKYGKKITHEYKKDIEYSKKGLFKDFDITEFKKLSPPKNDSKKVKEELELLSSLPEAFDFAEKHDKILECFEEYVDEKGHKVSKKMMKELLESCGGVIMELKYHFDRPRPQQVAEKLGMEIGGLDFDSAKSPSYPSGHSTQSKLIGEYLYSETKDKHFRKIAEKISLSRNVARVHYVSDSKMGELLGEKLYEYYKNKG
jgi:hypothetical protein